MVGIVIVSHSATLAAGVVELAREMGGAEVAIEPAGGTTMPDAPLGTDAALVLDAIERAQSGDGVLVLMDLGSAVMSAEMALDFLPEEARENVLLCAAPLVEGAVAAATAARIGRDLEAVADEARGGLAPKAAHLGAGTSPDGSVAAVEDGEAAAETAELEVTNRLGLHARPAARFVRTAGEFDADVSVSNLTTGAGPVSGASLNSIATLGVRQGHRIRVSARGPEAVAAVAAIHALADENFGDPTEDSGPPPAGTPSTPLVRESGDRPEGAMVGLSASRGIAVGPARPLTRSVPLPSDRPAKAPDDEWRLLADALEKVRAEIRKTRSQTATRLGEKHAEIFDAHLLMLDDEALVESARREIFEHDRNASQAWEIAVRAAAASFRALEDEYLAARGDDVEQVGAQVLRHLEGESGITPVGAPGVVVAHELTPADTAALDTSAVRGFVTAVGGPTSHSAILARALGVPAVVGAGEAVASISDGTVVVLDGDRGFVLVDPNEDVLAEYEQRIEQQALAQLGAKETALEPAITSDGTRIHVVANIGKPNDLARALNSGAEGIGLLRTEFLYLDRDDAPSEEEQYLTLRDIATEADGRPIVVRTLDAGADKPLGWLPQAAEPNPFLGVRGIRLGLTHPDVLRTQMRAIARVARDFPLSVMFPMVSSVKEYETARSMLAEEAATAGVPEQGIATGIMVEVPAAAVSARAFAPIVDFFSIGTNDLTQYTMAADRGNEAVGNLTDALHPAVLGLIAKVTEAGVEAGKWVGVCGELAGDPEAIPILVGLGVTELSMSAPSIPAVKAAVRAADLERSRAIARRALDCSSAAEVRALVLENSAVT